MYTPSHLFIDKWITMERLSKLHDEYLWNQKVMERKNIVICPILYPMENLLKILLCVSKMRNFFTVFKICVVKNIFQITYPTLQLLHKMTYWACSTTKTWTWTDFQKIQIQMKTCTSFARGKWIKKSFEIISLSFCSFSFHQPSSKIFLKWQ